MHVRHAGKSNMFSLAAHSSSHQEQFVMPSPTVQWAAYTSLQSVGSSTGSVRFFHSEHLSVPYFNEFYLATERKSCILLHPYGRVGSY